MKKSRKTSRNRKITRRGPSQLPAGIIKDVSPAHCETWAASRLKCWGKLTDDDYSFKGWAGQRSGESADQYAVRLAGACIYEYARHMDNLRGLLLMQKQFEDGPESFRGYDWTHAEEKLGPWMAVLQCLAEELAENLPWLKVSEDRQNKALWVRQSGEAGTRNQMPRAALPFGAVFLGIPPVSTALELDAAQATTAEAMPGLATERERDEKIPARVGLCDGVEVVAVRVNWADATNKELGDEFAAWARRNRPEKVPEPNRKKTAWRADVSRRLLDALTVWRLIRMDGKSKSFAAQFLAQRGCNTVASGGDEANVGKLLNEAREFFEQWSETEPQAVKVSEPD
jgi:hypothetical protein